MDDSEVAEMRDREVVENGRRSNVIATRFTMGCHGSKKVASAAETRVAPVPQ